MQVSRKQLSQTQSALIVGCTFVLLGIMLIHVYLYTLGIKFDQFLTFWLPLEAAAFLVLISVIFDDRAWVFALVLSLAAALHFVVPIGRDPYHILEPDAIYGYQLVIRALETGRWQFGAGTGSSIAYSFFPMMFVFSTSWAKIGSIPPILIVNYGIPIVNLATLLTLRILCIDLFGFSKRQTNLILFIYSLTPIIHSIEAVFHYEAYAVIFLPLVFNYALKPRISFSERAVALVSILSITMAHFFTSYVLMLTAVVLSIAYLLIRGARIQADLLFLSVAIPAAWNGASVGSLILSGQVLRVTNVLNHFGNLSYLISRLTRQIGGPVTPYYPAPWFGTLGTIRDIMIVVFSLIAIISLCLGRGGRFGARVVRRDALTYFSASWIFSLMFSVAAYYGVAWTETVLASSGASIAAYRIAEFSFMPFALFSGLGLSLVLKKTRAKLHVRWTTVAAISLCLIITIIFVTPAVVQAYPRVVYDSSYSTIIYYDEYPQTFVEPYYLGNWWSKAGNHTFGGFGGSSGLAPFIIGYGHQPWVEGNLSKPPLNLNLSASRYNKVHFAWDLVQLQKPDRTFGNTMPSYFVSSNQTYVDLIFSTGRLVVLYKPST